MKAHTGVYTYNKRMFAHISTDYSKHLFCLKIRSTDFSFRLTINQTSPQPHTQPNAIINVALLLSQVYPSPTRTMSLFFFFFSLSITKRFSAKITIFEPLPGDTLGSLLHAKEWESVIFC